MICSYMRVVYVPIEYGKRIGHSKIRAVDFFNFVMLVLRIVMLFQPLRIFMPLGALLFVLGIAKGIYDLTLMEPVRVGDLLPARGAHHVVARPHRRHDLAPAPASLTR